MTAPHRHKLTLDEFLAHALAIEEEAVLRYRELSLQMEVHNNEAVSKVFSDLAAAEEEHAERVRQLARGHKLPALKPWEYRWQEPESPESAPYEQAHYLMMAHHALAMALAAERRAQSYFADAAVKAADPKLKALAKEFADEETLHAEHIAALLERTPKPPSDWTVDYDPPVSLA